MRKVGRAMLWNSLTRQSRQPPRQISEQRATFGLPHLICSCSSAVSRRILTVSPSFQMIERQRSVSPDTIDVLDTIEAEVHDDATARVSWGRREATGDRARATYLSEEERSRQICQMRRKRNGYLAKSCMTSQTSQWQC